MEYASVSTSHGEIVVLEQGQGEPLMLIPGHTMSIQRWIEAGYVGELSKTRRVIAVDPLGHGRSEKSSDPAAYSWDKVTQRMVAVADHFALEAFDVWGYSRGAAMGNLLAAAIPNRVRTLVYGGRVLFDPQPILKEMGLVRSDEALKAQHDACLAGDWALTGPPFHYRWLTT